VYQPVHFNQPDSAAIAALIAQYSLATLVTQQDGALTADHIPLVFDPAAGAQGTLRGHVARANPLWRVADQQTVLAVFQGPQAYVSPSWYPSKAATAKVVPTWNYAVVHAHGRLSVIDDVQWLRAFVTRLTDKHESAHAHPWAVSDAPADYINQMLRAIVGIEIELTRIDAKWKLSQNRQAADRLGVAAGLSGKADGAAQALAAMMRALPDAP
jgi:transcriptional regulator